LKVDKLMMNVT